MKTKALTIIVSLLALSPVRAAAPPVDLDLAAAEVSRSYGKAHPLNAQ